MGTPISRLRRLVPAAGLSALVAATAFALPVPASSEACPAIDPPAATPALAPEEAGIRVFVDPATGRIRRPTREERQRIAVASARDRSGRTYEVRTRPDGTRLVKLDETFTMSVVATTTPDGTVSSRCAKSSTPQGAVEETEK